MIDSKPLFTKTLLFCFALLLSLLVVCCTCAASEPQQITMSLQQYNKLSRTLTEQEQVLNKLKTRIELLQTPSSELMLQLETAKSELESCKQNLDLSMQNLVGAMNSISKLKTNLNQLKAKVSKLENQAKHRGQQRDKAYVGCGILLILLLV